MPIAACPECEAEIHVDEEMDKGETLICEDCEAHLTIVGLDPIELDVTDPNEYEDYDDDYGYDDE